MVDKEVAEPIGGLKKLVPTGTCVLIEGLLAETPEGTKQVSSRVFKDAVYLCTAPSGQQHGVSSS